MAIVINTPGAGEPLGPGQIVNYTISAGPIPNDDYVALQITRDSDSAGGPVGDHVTKGLLNGGVVFGVFEVERFNPLGNMFFDGDACHYFVYQSHANGTIVQSSTPIACTYRPIGLLWQLLPLQANAAGVLGEILAAVKTIFPGT